MKPLNLNKKEEQFRLWYEKPAKQWIKALPLGNGRIGAMVFGGVETEKIALTEATCYSGENSIDNNQKGAPEAVLKMKEALFTDDYKKARELHEEVYGKKLNYGTNLPVGNLLLNFNYNLGNCSSYFRDLCLDTAVSAVEYEISNIKYTREIFVSNPHQVMIIKLSSNGKECLYFDATLDGGDNPYEIKEDSNGDLLLTGNAYEKLQSDGKTGVTFHGRMRIISTKGVVSILDKKISVKGADSVVILLALGTTYENNDVLSVCKAQLDKAAATSYDNILETHIKDHQRLFNRVELDLGTTLHSVKPTDYRLAEVKNGKEDLQLTALMFQYGRYLLMSSSRENSPLPTHLQGIWNDDIACRIAWTCDMHLDINTQMNYWPAEVTNLSECTAPLFKWIEEKLVPSGRLTAKETYGLNGWVAHIFSNPYGYSAPGWGAGWALHPTGGAWIATHLWEHYLYTRDERFLEQTLYPVYKEAVEFFLQYLVVDSKSEYLLSGPSISPENFFSFKEEQFDVSMGATIDTIVIRELFDGFISSSEILGYNEEKTLICVREAVKKLPPFKIGKYGQLQEWFYDFEEPDLHHRHTSHLLSLFPFSQIGPEKTPELVEAAKISIKRRSTPKEKWEDTGWAHSLLLLYSARLLDNEGANTHILDMQRTLTNDNLLIFHPPTAGADTNVYELDGNTGFCAGIAEMILQSQDGVIYLLPTLPKAWQNGSVKGLCARGGFEVEIIWEKGQLIKAQIYSKHSQSCVVRYKNTKINLKTEGGCKYVFDRDMKFIISYEK